jgi:hypothetical protein
VLTGRGTWAELDAALAHPELPPLVARPIQTNEVRRSWLLLPCFLEVARLTGEKLFDVIELGASAGFNLLWDRYRYGYRAGAWGPTDAPLELDGEERAPVPSELLSLAPRVRRRVGIDLDPVDASSPEGALRLRSFLWPGQGRLERLERAIDAVQQERPRLVRGDMVDVLPQLLSESSDDAFLLVFETAVLGYLSDETWGAVRDQLAAFGRNRPLALVWTDRPAEGVHTHWGLWLQLWPGGEQRLLALADFHGAWLEWL